MSYPYKILILDDDKLVTSSLKSLLLIEGFNDVVYYNSPKEALEYLKNNDREVVISDFMMPEMNGIEFLTEAKKLNKNASMILLTGYADKENAIKAINEVGLYKYIEKPWDNDSLIINIKNAYERANLINELEDKNKKLENYSLHLEELVKQKTTEIVEMNEHLAAIITNCADGIIVFDKDKNILNMNPAAESLFGVNQCILSGKKVGEIFIGSDVDWEEVFASDEDKILRDINIENIVSGDKIPVEISCSYIPPKDDKHISKYVFVIRNIHFQKEMERLREDFIATLTHDLRTPSLAAIQTLEYFLNGKLGSLNEKQTLFLSNLKKSNEDMLGLVNTLLEVYKYEAGRLSLVKTAFCFKNLIDECIEQVEPLAKSKNQTIEKFYDGLGEAEIYADRNELRRVIINLLGNAIKYTQQGGQIEVKSEIDNNDLRFSVKDNGDGIFKKDIPKLFKRFSQGTQEKRSISTGLGLYLSKQIIDAHGGKIWLESDKGKGSEFFFLLLDVTVKKAEDKLWKV